MQPQPVQNMFISTNTGANNTGSIRSNHPSGVFRHSASSSTQRNRYMFPTALQSVVFSQYSIPRQGQYQQYTYGQQYYPSVPNAVPNYYPPYYNIQHTAQQRAPPVGANANIGLANTISVQPGTIPGPPTSNQSQISLGVSQVAASVLGVSSASSVQTINVSPIISVIQSSNTPIRKQRPHALKIIDPETKRNIFDETPLSKVASPTDVNFQESILPSLIQERVSASDFNLQKCGKNQLKDVDKINATPVVSAISNSPSVEIHHNKLQSIKHNVLAGTKVDNKEYSDSNTDGNRFEYSFHTVTDYQVVSAPETISAQTKDVLQESLDEKCYDKITSHNSALKVETDYLSEVCQSERNQITCPKNKQELLNETMQVEILDVNEKEKNVGSHTLVKKVEGAEQNSEYLSNLTSTIITALQTSSEVERIEDEKLSDSQIDDLSLNLRETNNNRIVNSYNKNFKSNKHEEHFCDASRHKEVISNDRFPHKNVLSKDKLQMQTFPEEAKTFPKDTTTIKMLINYNKEQWSPSNLTGKKIYNKEQLLKLREAEASKIQPDVKHTSILPGFNLLPAFVFNNSNKKFLSMVGAGINRCSEGSYQNNFPKQSSVSIGGRIGGHQHRDSSKPMIHVNLSLNQDVKLSETANAWRPRILTNKNEYDNSEIKTKQEKEELVRSVRGILNKLTPERFTPLLNEILKLNIDTNEKRDIVMIMVFEKAIDEPNFSVSYANLCQSLISDAKNQEIKAGVPENDPKKFCKSFLDKMEAEFRSNVINIKNKEEKLKPIKEKIKSSKDSIEKSELEALLEEEIRKIRRRSSGNVRFIGELFNVNILSGKIINTCIEDLLKQYNNEDMLECLCKLLTTVGEKFEKTLKPKTESKPESKVYFSLQSVIARMKTLTTRNKNSKISSRVRFMLQDVIDLRANKWRCTRIETPTTLEEIEKESQNEQLTQQLQNCYTTLPSNGSGHIKRDYRHNENRTSYSGSHSQRGDSSSKRNQHAGSSCGSQSIGSNSNIDGTWHVQTNKGSRLDSNKLEFIHSFDASNRTMGGVRQFQWNACNNSFAALSLSEGNSNCANINDKEKNRFREKKGQSRNLVDVEHDNLRNIDRPVPKSENGFNQSRSSTSSYRTMSVGISEEFAELSAPSQYRNHGAQSSSSPIHISENEEVLAVNASGNFERPRKMEIIKFKSIANEMIENAENLRENYKINFDTTSCIENIKKSQHCGFLYYILSDYLHLCGVTSGKRRQLSNCVAYLIEKEYISKEMLKLAYKNFADSVRDTMKDVPELWRYICEFLGPLILKNYITMNDLSTKELRNDDPVTFGMKFLKFFLQYCTYEIGPNYTRKMWKKLHLKWADYMPTNEVTEFIRNNNFEYIENENLQPYINTKESKDKRIERVTDQIKQLVKEESNTDAIIDYIAGNVAEIDKSFIRNLTITLCSIAIKYSVTTYKLDKNVFQEVCIPILLQCIDSKDILELECLYAMQFLFLDLHHPPGLLTDLFIELNDADVIQHDTFRKWRDSTDQTVGKGVAVKAVNPFFNQALNGETSDDY